MDNSPRELSYGEKAVGLTFNPGQREDVNTCKVFFANAIDHLDMLRKFQPPTPEKERMFLEAVAQIQTAQMWAVKVITWQN